MSSPSQEGVIFVKIPEERQQPYHKWISPEKQQTYSNLLPPGAQRKESLPTHATPIQVPTKTTYRNPANCYYERLTFHRYRFSSPYSPYNSFTSLGKAKQTYGKRQRCQNKTIPSVFFSHDSEKNNSSIQKSCINESSHSSHDYSPNVLSKESFHISSQEKSDSDIDDMSKKTFNLRTPKHDDFSDSNPSSNTKTNHLLCTSSPRLLPSRSSSPDFSVNTKNQSNQEIDKMVITVEKSKLNTENAKPPLKNSFIKKTNGKDSNVRILDIKNWWTGKFLEDSTNMQLMLSKKGFALQKNGELLPPHNYSANEIRSIAYEFDEYGLFYIRLKNRNVRLNGPGTEYLIQIMTTSKLKSLRVLQYSCPEVDLVELTPSQAQKILSLKKPNNSLKKTNLSDYSKSENTDTNIVEVPDHLHVKLNETKIQTNSKTHLSYMKDKKNDDKNKPRLVYPPVVLYDDDIERLNDGEFLNDTIIDFYLKYIQNKLFQNNPSKIEESYIFNTFFYKRLVDKDRFGKKGGYQNVRKWTSKTKIDLFTKKYVVVPVNESLHWYVAIICNLDAMSHKPSIKDTDKNIQSTCRDKISPFFSKKKKTTNSFNRSKNYNIYNNLLSFQDNKANDKDKYNDINMINQETDLEGSFETESYTQILSKKDDISTRKPVIIIFDSLGGQHNITLRNLRDYLYEEAKDKRDLELDKANIAGIHAKVPQQSNYCDCGVFLLHYVEQFLNDPDRVLPFILNHHNKTPISSDIKDLWGQEKISSLRSELRLLIKHLQDESFVCKNDTNSIYLNQENTTDNDDHNSDDLIMYF
ncbi:hypothetical protein PORY_000481 [Pneumocystis oryctolagi]|uniref:Uncharacterized protein n=1 Tax=Pneumocystis oryctolagi TaxID=42067 RepID=A0ACB7CFU1_9ASCO|nr:hypothetical protein PORY_000481 [Pneumocystis oryctolagi]